MPHGWSTDWHCLLKTHQLIYAVMTNELPPGKIGSVITENMPGQRVFCDIRCARLEQGRGIDGSVEFSCGVYREYTSLCWGGSLWLLFLVYVWLSCRAVSAVVCIESIPANVFSSLRHMVHALSVLQSPSGRCLSVGFALWADACDGLKSLECINSNL